MALSASSFQVPTPAPSRVASEVTQTIARVHRPAAGLVFVSGGLAARFAETVEILREGAPGIPLVVVAGAGVLSEDGELEDQSAASGVVWAGGRTEICPLAGRGPEQFGESLSLLLADRTTQSAPTALVFAEPESFGPSALLSLRESRGTPYVFGAGTTTSPGVASIEGGHVTTGPLAMILRGISPPAIRTTHSCRLVTPLSPITVCRGSLVLEIGGKPALEALSEAGRRLQGQQLILTMLAEAEGSEDDAGQHPALIVRGVQGVDTDRGGLVISDEVYEGMRVAFAVRDANAARSDIETTSRELARDIGGAAPRFGIYINCSGRGFGLYGTPGVDTRTLRSRFPNLPFAGMQSAYEIAPHAGRPTMQLYTGVFALFAALS